MFTKRSASLIQPLNFKMSYNTVLNQSHNSSTLSYTMVRRWSLVWIQESHDSTHSNTHTGKKMVPFKDPGIELGFS